MTNNGTSDVEAIILWRDIPSTDDARSGDRGILPLWMTDFIAFYREVEVFDHVLFVENISRSE